ncbi:hypothetical protein [Antarctobacter heliothermus]|uniref:Sulfotransferase family protein n=1 Tax=Antarctobacter heliothermus TaxID=74033 RepID=A0A239HHE8_9RHOB|nr:hypothetical protein [Antarctobacter heliothermus]SNS80760.1 hypothetical protein SAMN04488078_103410 [Antarctobacter heliothermus]
MMTEPVSLASKRVIVHLGLPKTGSTAFQECAGASRGIIEGAGATLFQKDVTRGYKMRAKTIARHGPSPWRKAKLNKAARQLRARPTTQGRDSILITDENLLGWGSRNIFPLSFDRGPKQPIKALQKAFERYDPRWVVYTRDPKTHLRSAYRYGVKLRSVSEDFDTRARRVGSAETLSQLIFDTREFLGANGVFLDMKTEKQSKDLLEAPILRLVGIADKVIATMPPAPVTNVGIPDDLLEYVHRINAIGFDKERPLRAVDVLLTMHSDLTDGGSPAAYGRVE